MNAGDIIKLAAEAVNDAGAPINILKKYIESQGIKNGKKS